MPALHPKERWGSRAEAITIIKTTGHLEPRGGRAQHGTHPMNQAKVFLPSVSVSIRFSERSRNWRY